ncbi:MAG: type II toxin-antitoxin system HicA family toxin [Candidatus Kapabacteria bacterium]|nr:type II toxin-antitoxin system HicA family toxin [Candidatus Kapabacteria bacterium]
MPKLPILTAKEAEKILLALGFALMRTKGSHRIYGRDKERFVIPYHSGKNLHPKIVKSVVDLVDENRNVD